MAKILICVGDPLISKTLYGALKNRGHEVDTVERAAEAVQKSLQASYELVILDADSIGMSASDAADMILHAAGASNVIILGQARARAGVVTAQKPLDIGEICRLTALCHTSS